MSEQLKSFLAVVYGLPDQCGFDPGCWFIAFWLVGFTVVFYAIATVFVVALPLAILSSPFYAIYHKLSGKDEERGR